MRVVGIDPGTNGGLALLEDGVAPVTVKMPATIGDTVEWLRKEATVTTLPSNAVLQPKVGGIDLVVIERQEPRPTYWKPRDREPQRSILKSTVLLYGGYRELLGALAALDLRVEDVRPQAWQKALGIPAKAGKPGLKARAQQLFPGVKVTNWNADALLLAELGRRLLGKEKA